MSFDVEPGEYVQILRTGQGRWITISTTVFLRLEPQGAYWKFLEEGDRIHCYWGIGTSADCQNVTYM